MPTLNRRRFLAAFLFVAHALGIVSSLDALMSVRTAPGAVAWIVSLNTFPYVAVPAYWVFGRTKFEGYVNLDNRSFRLNFEITAWVFDPAFAAQAAAMFEDDFRHSREMTPAELTARSWWQRAAARAAYLLAPVL